MMQDPEPDIDALLLRGEGGTQAFAEVVLATYHSRVYRLCLSIVSDPADASDAAQEAFIDALSRIGRYRPGTNFRAWLSKIAVHKCYGLLRRRQRRRLIQHALERIHLTHGGARGKVNKGQPSCYGDDLEEAIDALTAKQQVVIHLRYTRGLPIKQIAGLLGVPEGTVHSRLHYAIHNLRKSLRD
jgi:RNA polymerase sigma-70 factor (ECF subfamily)